MAERSGRDGIVTEPSDQREVGRHHRDLTELGQRNGNRKLHGRRKLDARALEAGSRRQRGVGQGHAAQHSA
jgi:hypothetical protein